MFCNGVVTMQSMGLGGGFLMTIYSRAEKKAYFLNAREKAPLAANDEKYKDSEKSSQHGKIQSLTTPQKIELNLKKSYFYINQSIF